MSEPFAILAQFLERFGSDVEGRSLETVPPELRRQLHALACGELAPGDRARLAEALKSHPEWIAELATQVKARRPNRTT